jgi:hypothetical protein
MATIIQIKRSTGTTAPSTLTDGELAYTHGTGTQSNNGDRLFVGDGTSVNVIGGQYFVNLTDHVPGTLTATSALLVDSNKAIDDIYVGNNSSTGGSMKFNEGTANGTEYVALKSPNALDASVTFTLPAADGNTGEFLKTNGSGALSFDAISTSFTLAADSGTSDTFNTSETLTFAGGDGLGSVVSNNSITFNIDSTVATLTGSQSLTNKTISGASNTLSNIGNGSLTNSAVTINGVSTSLGASSTVTAAAGTLTGTSLNSTVVTSSLTSVGTIATGVWNGTAVAVGYGGTGAANAGDARTNLGVAIGSDVQAYNSTLAAVAGGTYTGVNTITTLGTIATGVWQGTAIANAYLANSAITIGSDSTSLGGTITDLNGITSLDVDNITLDSNTISTTDANGDLVLSPNGTGTITVPSGYEGRAGFGSDSLVNKTYVDNVASGLDVKASVRVATTANLASTYNNGNGTLTASTNGAITVDGVALTSNDRVLVKDQTDPVQNGFYKVTTVGSGSAAFVLTRTPDANEASEITGGAFTFVEEGSANADNGYVASHNGIPTLGTDDITFEQFSGAGQISAGNGLTKTGNTIDAVGTSDRISVGSNAIDIASTYVGQSSITTLGTIATGTWSATAIGTTKGGTGLTTYTTGDLLYASASNTLAKLSLGTSGKILQSNGTNVTWSDIDGGTF